MSTATRAMRGVCLALLLGSAPAQQSGSGIAGVVSDPSGAVVPGARVTVQLQGSERREFALTSDSGQFALQPLPQGTYTLTVAKPGFALLKLEGIVVNTGAPTSVKPVLNIGKISENVEVRSERTAPQAVPSEPGSPTKLRVGGNVQASKIVAMTRPTYPADCRAEGVQGTVLLMAVIGTDGGVLNLHQVNELVDTRLVTAATEAVRQWRYQSTLLNGVPVEVVTMIEVNFTLAN
jgi:TonB family protein